MDASGDNKPQASVRGPHRFVHPTRLLGLPRVELSSKGACEAARLTREPPPPPPSREQLFFLGHLGLGDMLAYNGMVRLIIKIIKSWDAFVIRHMTYI